MSEPRPPIYPAPDDWPETRDYHREQADEIERLRARVKELEAALREVERWWLVNGKHVFLGAPYAIFAARAVLAKGETR